jgi:hypothetical protein
LNSGSDVLVDHRAKPQRDLPFLRLAQTAPAIRFTVSNPSRPEWTVTLKSCTAPRLVWVSLLRTFSSPSVMWSGAVSPAATLIGASWIAPPIIEARSGSSDRRRYTAA